MHKAGALSLAWDSLGSSRHGLRPQDLARVAQLRVGKAHPGLLGKAARRPAGQLVWSRLPGPEFGTGPGWLRAGQPLAAASRLKAGWCCLATSLTSLGMPLCVTAVPHAEPLGIQFLWRLTRKTQHIVPEQQALGEGSVKSWPARLCVPP